MSTDHQIIIGVSGARLGHPLVRPTLDALLLKYECFTLCVGDAYGVDKQAWMWSRNTGIRSKVFKANWKAFGDAAGMIRNREMSEHTQTEYIFGSHVEWHLFPSRQSKGTYGMLTLVLDAGLEHVVHHVKESCK